MNDCWYRNSVLSPKNLKYLKEIVTITEKKSTHTYRKHFATHENKEKVVETPPKPKGTYTQKLRAVKTTTTTTTLIQRHIITEYIYREQTVTKMQLLQRK